MSMDFQVYLVDLAICWRDPARIQNEAKQNQLKSNMDPTNPKRIRHHSERNQNKTKANPIHLVNNGAENRRQ